MSTALRTPPTSTQVTYPIVAALLGVEEKIKSNGTWFTHYDRQEEFLENFFHDNRDEISNIPEIETLASGDVSALNDFLRKRGFTIQLDKFTSPDDFGVVSILELLLDWRTPGKKTIVRAKTNGEDYPAVQMKSDISFFSVQDYDHPVVMIRTNTDDVVYLTIPKKGGVAEEDLDSTAGYILSGLHRSYNMYDTLVFPMIDLMQRTNISWLQGMYTYGADEEPGIIRQALQETIFKMDEVGAVVKSAVAISAIRASIQSVKETFTIDQPFIAIVSRPGLSKPLFVGYLNTDCWAKPNR